MQPATVMLTIDIYLELCIMQISA